MLQPTLALIRINLRLAFREKMVLFFNYFFPLIFFFVFAQVFKGMSSSMTQIVTMVITFGILGNGLFGAGIRAVQERETNILRRYKVAPITPLPIVMAQIVVGLLVYLPSVVILLTLANVLYHAPLPERLSSFVMLVALGAVAFRAIGLIIASVANSMGESNILVQIFYMPMIFLSGATFPLSLLPTWAQIVGQFLPASYLLSGMQSIVVQKNGILDNLQAVGALSLTTVVAIFVSVKLFRWEKDEKIKNASKAWLLAVFLPFLILGVYQAKTRENLTKNKEIEMAMRRNHGRLIKDARIVIGDGKVIPMGSILFRNGKIEQIWEGQSPSADSLKVDAYEAVGKTVMPGLNDVHVHLGAPGAIFDKAEDYSKLVKPDRELAGYLYSGVTGVRSVGDMVDTMLPIRAKINSGQYEGAEFFACGPLFTTEGGHGTEYFKQAPEQFRKYAEGQFVRTPKTPEEARQQVTELKQKGVDCIKAVLEAGGGSMVFNRMDVNILKAIAEAAHAQGLHLTVHTGNARDVEDAVNAGADGVEHGSMRDPIPDAVLAQMARKGVFYDPTLTVFAGVREFAEGNFSVLDNSLVQQTQMPELLANVRKMINSEATRRARETFAKIPMSSGIAIAQDNLKRALAAGVPLVTGTDAGNPLVFHGPMVHRELKLWVEAGIPPLEAIRAATANSARALGAANRFGTIKKGMEATLVVVDGNPLEDISATTRISSVFLKGARVDRADLFDQK